MKRTPMPSRSRSLTRTVWKRRSKAATAAEVTARELVAARAQGRCEGCGRPGPTDWAHRVKRSQGGPWCPTNGLALCRPCHDWSDHQNNRVEAESIGWMLRRHHDPASTPALLHGVGRVLLTPTGTYLPQENAA